MAAATLRSFQNEIDEIHTREVARQRATGAATVDKDKENKMPKGKAKDESIPAPKPGAQVAEEEQTNMQEVEDRILVCNTLRRSSCTLLTFHTQGLLLSKTPADHDAARDQIAALITRANGEYVIRIGERPPRNELFTEELNDSIPGWTGTPRTFDEIEKLIQELKTTVEEVGGKVHISLLRPSI
jgi:hypothetical protein